MDEARRKSVEEPPPPETFQTQRNRRIRRGRRPLVSYENAYGGASVGGENESQNNNDSSGNIGIFTLNDSAIDKQREEEAKIRDQKIAREREEMKARQMERWPNEDSVNDEIPNFTLSSTKRGGELEEEEEDELESFADTMNREDDEGNGCDQTTKFRNDNDDDVPEASLERLRREDPAIDPRISVMGNYSEILPADAHVCRNQVRQIPTNSTFAYAGKRTSMFGARANFDLSSVVAEVEDSLISSRQEEKSAKKKCSDFAASEALQTSTPIDENENEVSSTAERAAVEQEEELDTVGSSDVFYPPERNRTLPAPVKALTAAELVPDDGEKDRGENRLEENVVEAAAAVVVGIQQSSRQEESPEKEIVAVERGELSSFAVAQNSLEENVVEAAAAVVGIRQSRREEGSPEKEIVAVERGELSCFAVAPLKSGPNTPESGCGAEKTREDTPRPTRRITMILEAPPKSGTSRKIAAERRSRFSFGRIDGPSMCPVPQLNLSSSGEESKDSSTPEAAPLEAENKENMILNSSSSTNVDDSSSGVEENCELISREEENFEENEEEEVEEVLDEAGEGSSHQQVEDQEEVNNGMDNSELFDDDGPQEDLDFSRLNQSLNITHRRKTGKRSRLSAEMSMFTDGDGDSAYSQILATERIVHVSHEKMQGPSHRNSTEDSSCSISSIVCIGEDDVVQNSAESRISYDSDLPAPRIIENTDPTPEVRRSRRRRLPPLLHSLGQYPRYQTLDDGTRQLVGVNRVKIRDKQAKKYGVLPMNVEFEKRKRMKFRAQRGVIRREHRKGRMCMKVNETGAELSAHREFQEEDMVTDGFLTVWDPTKEDDVKMKCHSSINDVVRRTLAGEDWVTEMDSVVVEKKMDFPSLSSGNILIRPLGQYAPEPERSSSTIFSLLRGKVEVRIHESTFLPVVGDDFLVPIGNKFAIKNLREDEAKLYFVNVKYEDDSQFPLQIQNGCG